MKIPKFFSEWALNWARMQENERNNFIEHLKSQLGDEAVKRYRQMVLGYHSLRLPKTLFSIEKIYNLLSVSKSVWQSSSLAKEINDAFSQLIKSVLTKRYEINSELDRIRRIIRNQTGLTNADYSNLLIDYAFSLNEPYRIKYALGKFKPFLTPED